MRSRSLQALAQMSLVLAVVATVVIGVTIWRWEYVSSVFLSDWKSVLLNGLVVVIFALGVTQLYRAFGHYAREERALARFEAQRHQGRTTAEILAEATDGSQLADRYHLVCSLFERGVPIDHGAIASIAQADESTRHAFPRFVNNVLILTGVFGTVSSLIFALIGASEVLRDAIPGEGMGLMLLGMNTALTTTATAIVCFFMFSYFHQKLMVVQTALASRLERTMLLEVIPAFRFEAEVVEHQTKILLNELSQLVMEIRRGVNGAQHALTDLEARTERDAGRWQAALQGQEDQTRRLDGLANELSRLQQTLREGFRLP